MGTLKRGLSVALMVGLVAVAQAAEDTPKINLDVTDQPIAQVLAQIQTQMPKMQICATAATTANVTVKLTDATPDAAIKAVAKALKGTCLRGYIIERTGPGDNPYTAAEFIDFFKVAREEWRKRLTPAQTQELEQRVRERFRGMTQNVSEMPSPELLNYDDPLLMWTFLPTAETINLDADGATLQGALDLFTLASGYTVLVEDGVDAAITMHEKNSALPAVLDKLAAASQAKWREFYLVSQPVKLSEQEAEKRADQAFGTMWSGFWTSPPEERARDIERVVQGLKQITPQQAQFVKAMPMARKMFTRMMRATTSLSAEQRREFQPVMQAVGQIMGN